MKNLFTICMTLFFTFFSYFSVSACTTAIISGKCTIDGRPVLWKHRDSDELQNKLAVFKASKQDFIGLVNSNDSLGLEVWAGYNQTGFAIMNSASYNLNRNDTTNIKDLEGILMKMALRECTTIEDFENMLLALPKPLGVEANFGVIDATGGAAYFETNNYNYHKIDVNDPGNAPFGYMIRTNFSATGEINEGYGYIRFLAAEYLFYNAAAENRLSTNFVLQEASRCLKHSLTNANLKNAANLSSEGPHLVCFQDFIPRYSSASTVVIHGVRQDESPEYTTMWTILGFQLCSVALPVWLKSDKLPQILTAPHADNAPLCSWALDLKKRCFPIERGSGHSYINSTALYNVEKTGIMQKLRPIEDFILKASEKKLEKWRKSGMSAKDVEVFYQWIDSTLTSEYQQLFEFYNIDSFIK